MNYFQKNVFQNYSKYSIWNTTQLPKSDKNEL